MAMELMYTSVPRGLKPGTTGFCTVALTGGMPAPMIQKLESLSGYSPVFRLGTPNAQKNPPEFAHWRPHIGGRYYDVLSHVCFAGADYSGRSNKFAHHVVLESTETCSAGPAWVMMQSGVMERQWTGEPRILSPGRSIPSGSNPPRICDTWARATGDAGWAGVLAEAFMLDASKPAYIIYEPGVDLLPLIDEAILLLPETVRWRATFSTYFTTLPAGLSCSWRCCVAGTPAAQAAPGNATSGVIIDLTSPFGPARESKYVLMARTGRGHAKSETSGASDRLITVPSQPREPIPPEPNEARPPLRSRPERPASSTYALSALGRDESQGVALLDEDEDSPSHSLRRRRLLLWLVAVGWPILVLAGGWQLLKGRTDPLVSLPANAAQVETLKEQKQAAEKLKDQFEQEAKRNGEELSKAKQELANVTKERDDARTRLDELTKQIADFNAKGKAPTTQGSAGDSVPVTANKIDTRPDNVATQTKQSLLSELSFRKGQFAVPWRQLRVSGRGKVEPPHSVVLLPSGTTIDRTKGVKILLPIDHEKDKWPLRFNHRENGVLIEYDTVDISGGNKTANVLAQVTLNATGIGWEWNALKPGADIALKNWSAKLDDLVACSVLQVFDANSKNDADEGIRKVQLREPLPLELDLAQSPTRPINLNKECALDLDSVKKFEWELVWVETSGWGPAGERQGQRLTIRSNSGSAEFRIELKKSRDDTTQIDASSSLPKGLLGMNQRPGKERELQKQVDKLQNDIQDLEGKRAALDAKINSLQADLKKKEEDKKIPQLKEALDKAEVALKALQKQRNETTFAGKRINELLRDRKALFDKLDDKATSANEVIGIRAQVAEIDESIDQLNATSEMKKLQPGINGAIALIGSRRAAYEEANRSRDLGSLRDQMNSQMNQRKQKEEQIRQKEKERNDKSQELAEARRNADEQQKAAKAFEEMHDCHVLLVTRRSGAIVADIHVVVSAKQGQTR